MIGNGLDISGFSIRDITDIHIKTKTANEGEIEVDFEKTLVFPGPQKLPNNIHEYISNLFKKIKVNFKREYFMLELDNIFWRGQRDDCTVDGIWFRLRKSSEDAPTLKTTPSAFPKPYQHILMNPALTKGGIILVTGGPGSGKSTTASAILVSRLTEHGGVAFTVEDPPEHRLNGWHGENGYCWQRSLASDVSEDNDWTKSMKVILRSQPVGTPLMLFIGEIRTTDAALMLVKAANNGFLVIATSFASDIISGIESFCKMIGKDNIYSFAVQFKVCLYQKITGDRFSVDCLVSDEASSTVAQIIKNERYPQLKDEINFQKNRLFSNFEKK